MKVDFDWHSSSIASFIQGDMSEEFFKESILTVEIQHDQGLTRGSFYHEPSTLNNH